MRPYLKWLKENGFHVRRAWDIKTGKWIGNGPLSLFPFQKRILGHCLTPDPDTGLLPYTTIVYSTRKKSGKTTIAASVGAWVAEEAYGENEGAEIYVSANILEQAKDRIFKDMVYHAENSPDQTIITNSVLTRLSYPDGTFAQALQQSYKAVAGGRQKLTLWDELWGITQEIAIRNWEEMTVPPTVPNSFRFVVTYAGFENESDLLWDLYISGVGTEEHEDGRGEQIPGLEDLPCWRNGDLFVFWDHEARMPWQTDKYYDSQRNTLRPAAFLRLHHNQWVTSHEQFIPVEWWDDAAKAFDKGADLWKEHPYAKYPVFIAIDAGVKRDCTAVVGCCYDQKRGVVIILFHKIWTPIEGEVFDLNVVESYIMEMYNKFTVVKVAYDPTHLHQMMTNLKGKGIWVEEFPQTVTNMTKASQNLYDIMKNKSLECYPDDEFRRHIQMAVAQSKGRGFRIVKGKVSERHHIDAAVALAMSAYEAVKSGGVDVSQKIVWNSPFSDFTSVKIVDEEQKKLPRALRDD